MIIIASADKLASLFPRETDRCVLGAKATRAKSENWSDWSTFKAKLDGNLAAAKGMGKACGVCHKLFRGKKAKKKKM